MSNDQNLENIAERIVRWAADHPLSAQEVETKYAHLLKGLPPLPAQEWGVVRLGRWAVRYWKGQVQALGEALDAAALPLGVAVRGQAPAPAGGVLEQTLQTDGPGAVASVKITAKAAGPAVDLALWLEPKAGAPRAAFTVTVLGAAGAVLAGPLSCAADNVVRFSGIEPGPDYTVVFERGAERWEIRWGIEATP